MREEARNEKLRRVLWEPRDSRKALTRKHKPPHSSVY